MKHPAIATKRSLIDDVVKLRDVAYLTTSDEVLLDAAELRQLRQMPKLVSLSIRTEMSDSELLQELSALAEIDLIVVRNRAASPEFLEHLRSACPTRDVLVSGKDIVVVTSTQ
jgi:hypothetical protein